MWTHAFKNIWQIDTNSENRHKIVKSLKPKIFMSNRNILKEKYIKKRNCWIQLSWILRAWIDVVSQIQAWMSLLRPVVCCLSPAWSGICPLSKLPLLLIWTVRSEIEHTGLLNIRVRAARTVRMKTKKLGWDPNSERGGRCFYCTSIPNLSNVWSKLSDSCRNSYKHV